MDHIAGNATFRKVDTALIL